MCPQLFFLCLLDWWCLLSWWCLPIPHQTWPCSAPADLQLLPLDPHAWGLPLAAGVPLGSIKELTLPATHTHPSTHSLKGDWHIRHPSSTLSSVFSAVARTPRWIVGPTLPSASRCLFYRLSLLTGKFPSPGSPPNGCFLGSPPLALVSKSASGETNHNSWQSSLQAEPLLCLTAAGSASTRLSLFMALSYSRRKRISQNSYLV